MADRKITDLTALAAGSQATGDLVTIVDVSESAAADKNKKMTVENLFKGIPGDVGIGTSAPSQKLHIFEATDGDVGIRIQNNDGFAELEVDADELNYNADSHVFNNQADSSEFMRINSSGNLGLGTASPGSPFHVKDSANTVARFESTDSIARIVLKDNAGESRLGTDGDNITFHTSSSENERARIDSSGRLGIGTTAPSAPLTVFGGSASDPTIRIEGGSAGTDNARIESEYNLVLACNGDGDQSDRKIQFRNNTSDLVAIDSSGNLGIGTTTPGSVTGSGIDLERSGPATLRLNDTSGNGAVLEIYSDDGEMSAVYDSRGNSANHGHQFRINGSEKLRMTSAGKLVVGHSSSTDVAAIQSQLQVVGADAATGSIAIRRDQDASSGPLLVFGASRSTSRGGNTVVQNGDQLGAILFNGADGTDLATSGARIKAEVDGTPGSNDMPCRLVFETTADNSASLTERMKVESGGTVLIGNSIISDPSDGQGILFTDGGFIRMGNSTGSGSSTMAQFKTGSGNTEVLLFRCDGDIENQNNRYSGISDVNLKENIVDAGSQWEDIKNIRVRKYNFRESTGYQTNTQIGVIAQEVELVSPGLVKDAYDVAEDGSNLETTRKSVSYSVLYMKAVKALQEAMDRIETLETKVAALEAQ